MDICVVGLLLLSFIILFVKSTSLFLLLSSLSLLLLLRSLAPLLSPILPLSFHNRRYRLDVGAFVIATTGMIRSQNINIIIFPESNAILLLWPVSLK